MRSGHLSRAARAALAVLPGLLGFPGLLGPMGAGSAAAAPVAACAAPLHVASSRQGGHQGEVTVSDTGTGPISGRTVRIALDGGGRITRAWNGILGAGADGAATVRDAARNGRVPAGGDASFGFLASAGPASAAVACTPVTA